MTAFTRRLLAFLLLLSLAGQPLLSLGEDVDFIAEGDSELANLQDDPDALQAQEEDSQDQKEKYVATASVDLKMRRGPGREYYGAGQVRKGDLVYILELGEEWSKIRTQRNTGYVLTQYLKDLRDYDASRGVVGDAANPSREPLSITVGTGDSSFKQGYKATTVKTAVMRAEPDDRSRGLTSIPTYRDVIVSHVQGDWSYAQYKGYTGYILNTALFKWDRIDPYAGPIPGNIVYPTLAFVKHTTDILDYHNTRKKPKILKTINPGSAICVEAPDEQGRYKTPYWRVTGYVTQEDIAYTMDVVPWEEAQVGDLISVMTTYYGVGVSTLNFQGRNWNIYLSTSMISGSVLQPGAQFNVNQCIGPYRRSTGYKTAPIASPTALVGYGGGTCQVNTTLYNTLIQVPILVNHRKVHANVGAVYALKGFDAAVGGGDINMIFTNTLPYAIRFNFFMSDGVLTCCIFRAA